MGKRSKDKTFSATKSNRKKFKGLLEASYNPNMVPEGAVKDKSLSGKRVGVYNLDAKTYVVHRGTANLKDWTTDFLMALGYENGNRFSHSKEIQKRAEEKYGRANVVTMGHSLGGRIAEKVGKRSAAVVTFNKATTPRSIVESYTNPNPKQHDVRTKHDLVSLPSLLQRKTNPVITLDAKTIDPLKAHGLPPLLTAPATTSSHPKT